MRSLFACLYAPLFLAGFLALALWTTAHYPPYWLVALLLPAIALSFLAEAWLPYEPQWNRPRGDRLRDGLHALFNESLNLAGVAAIPLVAAWLPNLGAWPEHWPLVLQLLLAILIADLGLTLVHYLSHRVDPLWRLHAVHHSVQRLYGFNGLMKHPLHQTIEALAGTAPLLVLGMPERVAALLAFTVALQLLLQHSNVDMRIGPLRHLFAWAPVHRFHHMKYGRAGDVNFALFFTFWDRLLGTAFHSDYRMGGDDLGIGSRPDYPRDYLAQLAEPFKAQPHGTSPEAPTGLHRA
ncbi:sterol desaturase family protein [Pseudomonas sp. LFM046]|uniref:sterol desaturase family protein n=1 Tax=Pseudomonas sp. LFM046 TaxID=1608357 RepID=UPI0005CF94CA|nr:sterol desaturase family protein [Pseudomonas sp. LFM046]